MPWFHPTIFPAASFALGSAASADAAGGAVGLRTSRETNRESDGT